jgi:hypothetical protein
MYYLLYIYIHKNFLILGSRVRDDLSGTRQTALAGDNG